MACWIVVQDLTDSAGARSTIYKQRLYLIRVRQSFTPLMRAAIDGTAGDFFGDAIDAISRGINDRVLLPFLRHRIVV